MTTLSSAFPENKDLNSAMIKDYRSSSRDYPSPNGDSGVIVESGNSTPCSEHSEGDGISGRNIITGKKSSSNCIPSNGPLPQNHLPVEQDLEAYQGPDAVVPTSNVITWLADQPVKIRMGEGSLAVKPISIVTAFRRTVDEFPDHPALAYKLDDQWTKISFSGYYDLVSQAAKAFIKVGLEMYHGVGIIGFNSAEWFISDLGAIFAGGLATGIYTTNSAEACQYVAHNARCNVIVVENDHQLQKILSVRNKLPYLKAIIQYRGKPKNSHTGVYSWQDFLDLGKEVSDEELNDRIKKIAPNKCCTLIYTSGTTGDPKGVMLSHDNFVWTATMAGKQGRLAPASEELISYLPLSHVAAQILDIFIPLIYAGTVYFAQPDALKGSLVETMKDVKPTIFLGVPRVWEKMQERMVSASKTQWTFQRKIAQLAKWIGHWGNMNLMNGGVVPYGWTVANLLVFHKVRSALGFDRCKFCMTAAAPIMKDTLDFFMSLDLPLMEIYGMSESTGPHTLSFPWKYRTISAGVELDGCSTKIAELDDVDDEDGEVCLNGRNIFMGYLHKEDKTKETLDDGGWLRSGDIGRKDSDGFLYITGRIKELLITAGGENISPILIEDHVKQELPCLSNCMLIGDQRKFLSMLITIKTEVEPITQEPNDNLTPVAIDWCKSLGCSFTKLSELIERKDERVTAAIQKAIDTANAKAPSRAQVIQKWTILPKDFSIPGGELGPTLKLKRNIVCAMYHETIESFYKESTL